MATTGTGQTENSAVTAACWRGQLRSRGRCRESRWRRRRGLNAVGRTAEPDIWLRQRLGRERPVRPSEGVTEAWVLEGEARPGCAPRRERTMLRAVSDLGGTGWEAWNRAENFGSCPCADGRQRQKGTKSGKTTDRTDRNICFCGQRSRSVRVVQGGRPPGKSSPAELQWPPQGSKTWSLVSVQVLFCRTEVGEKTRRRGD